MKKIIKEVVETGLDMIMGTFLVGGLAAVLIAVSSY